MDVNQFETVSEAMNYLLEQGYTANFEITKDSARCIETNVRYFPHDLKIKAYHRFEGSSSAADMSALYVIECNDGTKGCLLDAYGTYSNLEFSEFITQVPLDDSLK